MKITAIERQKRKKDKYNLFVDRKYFDSFYYEIINNYHFEADQIVDDKILQKATFDQEIKNAYEKSLNIISLRMNSEKELKRKLRKDYSEEAINKAISKLRKFNFLDDKRFSELWIKERKNERGQHLLQAELIKKGISREIIKNSLEGLSREEEKDAAKKLLEKKFKTTVKREKALQYLVYRGFDYETSKKAIEEEK